MLPWNEIFEEADTLKCLLLSQSIIVADLRKKIGKDHLSADFFR